MLKVDLAHRSDFFLRQKKSLAYLDKSIILLPKLFVPNLPWHYQ